MYNPIVITSSMIEATDEDCDESDLPSQISPTTSDIAEDSYHTNKTTSNKNLSNSIGNQPNISEAKHESLNCGSSGFLSKSLSTLNPHNESYNPVVSLVSLNGEASRYIIKHIHIDLLKNFTKLHWVLRSNYIAKTFIY